MCSQESHCRRIVAPFGTVVGKADSKVEDMVGGKGVLMAMMVDDNAEEVRRKNLARFCPNKEGRILFLLDCVGDGPIIIYMIYLAAHLQK